MPAGLLILVVVFHVMMVQFQALSPWQGGGFGMFSVADRMKDRKVACLAQDESGRVYHVLLSGDKVSETNRLTPWIKRAVTFPQHDHLKKLAQILFQQEYIWAGDILPVKERLAKRGLTGRVTWPEWGESVQFLKLRPTRGSRPLGEKPIRLSALKLTVWKKTFVNSTLEFSWKKIGVAYEEGTWV